MSRQPTPANILADVLTADVATPDRTALRNRLRWDYSQVAPVDRKAVEDAAVDILANGQRMQQSVIAIGERLIAVKRLLDHGQFGDWCDTEFSMSIRTAQNLMNVAREFSGKNETVSLLTDSAMYLLAAPSTPPAAREQAIDEAQATGKSPTKERVREIIAEHKPGPVVQPITTPTASEYSAAVQAAQPARPVYSALHTPPVPGWDDDDEAEYQALLPLWQKPALEIPLTSSDRITRRRVAERLSLERTDNLRHTLQERRRELWLEERRQERERSSAISNPDPVVAANAAAATVQIIEYDAAAPLPQRADEPVALPRGGDSRIERARHLIDLYLAVQAACDEAVEEEAAYEALVGTPSDLLAANRYMRQLPVALAEPIAKLRHLITIIQHPEEVSADA